MLITLARKPAGTSVVDSCLTVGTGAINVGASRIQANDAPAGRLRHGATGPEVLTVYSGWRPTPASPMAAGRFPSNLIASAAVDVGPASKFYKRISG